MEMLAEIAAIIFGLTTVGLGIFVFRQQQRVEELKRAREQIADEEHEVFDFLHGLGEAFSENIRTPQLHRLIVEGAMKVLEARGGALYLQDRHSEKLIPAYVSNNCPPMIRIPDHIRVQAESTPMAVESYVRLHAVAAGEGLLGKVWKSKDPQNIGRGGEQDAHFLEDLEDNALKIQSALVVPLIYSGNWMGILAVMNATDDKPFQDNDMNVFQTIAEQSAFALFNANIYSEASEKRRIDNDLQIARDIQRILLPSSAPEVPGFQICGVNIPARYVSGDYFDYVKVRDSAYGVVIADVSGKGVPASLIMAMCRSVLRSHASNNPSASDVLKEVNRQLFPDIKEDMFISMAYVILDPASDEVVLSRAGHDPPLLFKARENIMKKINPPGMAVGIDMGTVFDRINHDHRLKLEPNDCIILYTDGVTEAINDIGTEYGTQKMMQTIQQNAPNGAPAIIKALTDDLREFVGEHPQSDDITLIAIRKL